MRMLTIRFRRGLAVALAGAVLLVGALACTAGDSAAAASLTANLDDVKRMSQDNYVALEVYGKRIDRLEQENSQLSERIAQLEKDKRALLEVVNNLAALAPGGAEVISGAAALTGAMMSQTNEPLTRDTATEEQRAMVRQLVECGIPSHLIATLGDQAESETWMQIETGAMTIAEVETTIPIVCNSR